MVALIALLAVGAILLAPVAAQACPVTLSVLGAGLGTALSAVGAGGAATAIGGSVAAGAAAATGAGAAVGAGAGILGTAVTTGALASELALVGLSVGGAVAGHVEQQKAAERARKSADIEANARRRDALAERGRENRALAAEKEAAAIAGAQARGVVGNLQNRTSVQLATLVRQQQREQQQRTGDISRREEAVQSSTASEFARIEQSRRLTRAQARGPSPLSLAINIASAGLGAFGGGRR